jgi:esterase/lipase
MPDESININESVQVVENAKNVNEKTPARRSDARRKLVDLSTNIIEKIMNFIELNRQQVMNCQILVILMQCN